jgi:hypothetical protein
MNLLCSLIIYVFLFDIIQFLDLLIFLLFSTDMDSDYESLLLTVDCLGLAMCESVITTVLHRSFSCLQTLSNLRNKAESEK